MISGSEGELFTASASPPALLEVRDLRVEFPTRGSFIPALRGVTFDLQAGEVLGLVGESGSGKSVSALTTLGLLPDGARITSGSVRLAGQELELTNAAAMRRIRGPGIAMVFQDPLSSLNPLMRVGDQIAESIQRHFGVAQSVALSRAEELLGQVGIPDPARRVRNYPHEFSGGMRQRVMIAIALSCEPQVLIADEPTTALDVTVQAQVLDLLRRLRRDTSMSMILITHDLGVIASLADRVCVMYAGRVVEAAIVNDLYHRPRHPYTQGLLRSLPSSDWESDRRLQPIEGQPPDMRVELDGCPFAPRCPRVMDKCTDEDPPLISLGAGQATACWAVQGEQADQGAGSIADE